MKSWKSYVAGMLTAFLLCSLVGTAGARTGKVTQELEYRNIQVTLDGKKLDLRNAIGETVEPFMFGGTNYLPVRALAEALGLKVAWDGANATVVLTTPKVPAAPSQTAPALSYIGETAAKAAALQHAGLKESSVTWLRCVLEYEGGRAEYDLEFTSGNKAYDCEIDALTGEILSFDCDTGHRASGSGNAAVVGQESYIGEADAKAIALRHAGFSVGSVPWISTTFNYWNGRAEYDVEFLSGNTEYDYEIDALTGEILSIDHEAERHVSWRNTSAPSGRESTVSSTQTSYIGEAAAKAAALRHAGLSEGGVQQLKVKLDQDDGRAQYEVEFRVGRTEYSYDIDAVSGAVLDFEKELDD